MKEIIVPIDDITYRLAESEAAAKGITVPEMVKKYLRELTHEAWVESFRELTDAIAAEYPDFSASDNLPREELYDRNALR